MAYRDITPEVNLDSILLQSDRLTDVTSQVEGSIIGIDVQQGQMVKTGQRLCRLENTFLPMQIAVAQADVAKAESAFSLAEVSLERAKNLRENRAITQSDLDAQQADALAARAEVDAKRSTLALFEEQDRQCSVLSPVDGEVLLIYNKLGSHLPAGSPLMLIGDFSQLNFVALLTNSQMTNLLPLAAEYRLSLNLGSELKGLSSSYSGGFDNAVVFPASVTGITPPLAESAPFRQILWTVGNEHNILEPGVYTGVLLHAATRQALATPAHVFTSLQNPELPSVDDDGLFIRRPVVIGVTGGGLVEILDGARAGDIVIESDVRDLAPGMRLEALIDGETP